MRRNIQPQLLTPNQIRINNVFSLNDDEIT